jgi:hypothetical protein
MPGGPPIPGRAHLAFAVRPVRSPGASVAAGAMHAINKEAARACHKLILDMNLYKIFV